MIIVKIINRIIHSEPLERLENWVLDGPAKGVYTENKEKVKSKCTSLAGKLKKLKKVKV